jgi:hypothetical protein
MGKSYSWNNVYGEITVDFENSSFEQNVLDYLVSLAKKNDLTVSEDGLLYSPVTIGFLSSGHYDPGKYYGPWEDSYPEEESDEREMESVSIWIDDKEIDIGDKKIAEIIFSQHSEQIQEVELEF